MGDLSVKIFGAAVISVIAIIILKRESPDTAMTLRLVVSVMLAAACVFMITPLVDYIKEISETVGNTERITVSCEVLLKALGISILTHATSTVCRDAGEGSIAYYVELGGKIEIMILALPLVREIIDMTLELIEMS